MGARGAWISEMLGQGRRWGPRKVRLPLVAGSFVVVWGLQEKPPPTPPQQGHGPGPLMRFSWQLACLPASQPLCVIAALSRSGAVKTRDYTVSVVPF